MESFPPLRPSAPSEIQGPLPHEEGYLDHLGDSTDQQGHSARIQGSEIDDCLVDANSLLEQEYEEIKTSFTKGFEIYQDQPSFFQHNFRHRFIRATPSRAEACRRKFSRRLMASELHPKPHEAQLDNDMMPLQQQTQSLFDSKPTSPDSSTPTTLEQSLIEYDDLDAEPPTSPLNHQSPSSIDTPLDQYQHLSEMDYQPHSVSTQTPSTPLIMSIDIDQSPQGESTSSDDAKHDDDTSLEDLVYNPLWIPISHLSDASHSQLLEIIDGLQRHLAQVLEQSQKVEQESDQWRNKYIACLNQNHQLARALSMEQQRKLEAGIARGQRAAR
ncbi:hypothetical protein CDD81_356 [Ophiocordyceps australis]|uniref:Uncharacterized protein n=1 Tax=Ophiocordyceps australis TaxID=1399860 RepID=A0A2C5XG72_9HYPO|nr:hypothetical protein CDD81_356 [Ophiocordyceps australis]